MIACCINCMLAQSNWTKPTHLRISQDPRSFEQGTSCAVSEGLCKSSTNSQFEVCTGTSSPTGTDTLPPIHVSKRVLGILPTWLKKPQLNGAASLSFSSSWLKAPEKTNSTCLHKHTSTVGALFCLECTGCQPRDFWDVTARPSRKHWTSTTAQHPSALLLRIPFHTFSLPLQCNP